MLSISFICSSPEAHGRRCRVDPAATGIPVTREHALELQRLRLHRLRASVRARTPCCLAIASSSPPPLPHLIVELVASGHPRAPRPRHRTCVSIPSISPLFLVLIRHHRCPRALLFAMAGAPLPRMLARSCRVSAASQPCPGTPTPHRLRAGSPDRARTRAAPQPPTAMPLLCCSPLLLLIAAACLLMLLARCCAALPAALVLLPPAA